MHGRRLLAALRTYTTIRIRTALLVLAIGAAAALLVLSLASGERSPQQVQAGPPPTETSTPLPTETPTRTPKPADAVAKVITASADLIEGPMSRGRLGDFLLANGEIQVVIQDVQRNILSVGQFGGQILDADLVRAPADPERDSFEEWAVGINIENTAHYTSFSTSSTPAHRLRDWVSCYRRLSTT